MNQIMSFKSFLIEKVLSREKDLTTRIATPYRAKLKIDNLAYIYTGIRTKAAKKHANAIIINKWSWNQAQLKLNKSPLPEIEWNEFWKREGFEDGDSLYHYFTQKQYLGKNLLTFQFKLIKIISLQNWI